MRTWMRISTIRLLSQGRHDTKAEALELTVMSMMSHDRVFLMGVFFFKLSPGNETGGTKRIGHGVRGIVYYCT
jgi:hypothetical protein